MLYIHVHKYTHTYLYTKMYDLYFMHIYSCVHVFDHMVRCQTASKQIFIFF